MATLTNCYIPLPSSHYNKDKSPQKQTPPHSHRKRLPNELRQMYMDLHILSKADGSSIVEIGQTKVLCAVNGPRSFSTSMSSSDIEFHEEGILNVDVKFATQFAVRPETIALTKIADSISTGTGTGVAGSAASTQHLYQQQAPEEIETSSRVYDAIFSSVPLRHLQKSVLDVHIMVLQADGGVTSACIIAASLALADAGVELYDLVSSCSVAVAVDVDVDVYVASISSSTAANNNNNNGEQQAVNKNKYTTSACALADPTEDETNDADGVVTLAMSCSWNEVTFWNQTGRISGDASSRAMEVCKEGCSTIHQCMRQCLLSNKQQ